jgi:hypothetical protein
MRLRSSELTQGLVQHLQSSRHLQADQGFAAGRGWTVRSRWSRSLLISLTGQAPADGLVEVERAGGDDIAGTQDQERCVATGIGDPRHFPMPRGNPALMAALQHRVRGDQGPVFEDRNFVGERMRFDDPLPGRVRHAVKIAADAHHALMRDPAFQHEDRAERRQRQHFEMPLLLGEGLLTTRGGRGVHARIGHHIQPIAQVSIQVVEIAERAGEEEVLADIAIGSLDLSLCFGPIRTAGPGLEAIMSGEVDQRPVVDDAAAGVVDDPVFMRS